MNCKAGNAVGGSVDFTVTISVTEIAYTNNKSLNFNGTTSFLQGNPVNVTALERATNGDAQLGLYQCGLSLALIQLTKH